MNSKWYLLIFILALLVNVCFLQPLETEAQEASSTIHSLSQKLNLKVNGYYIILNQELNESELNAHKFEKGGFLVRQIIEPEHNELVFWSKNCELEYLKEEFSNTIVPFLDVEDGAAAMYGTSSYLWYKQNKLLKFVFQIIYNKLAAQRYLEQFEKQLIDSIGKPLSSNGSFSIWEMENQRLILEYPKNGHGYIHLMISE